MGIFIWIDIVWVTYGLMFGAFCEDYFSALNMSSTYVTAADVASGKFINISGNLKNWRNYGIWFLRTFTPNAYFNEKLMRRFTSGTEDYERPALFFFGYTLGE
jgi:hypothetical protein